MPPEPWEPPELFVAEPPELFVSEPPAAELVELFPPWALAPPLAPELVFADPQAASATTSEQESGSKKNDAQARAFTVDRSMRPPLVKGRFGLAA